MAGLARLPDLANQPHRVDRTFPHPRADRAASGGLCAFHSCRAAGCHPSLAPTPLRRLPILWLPDCLRIPGLLPGLLDGSRARAAFPAEIRAALSAQWLMAVRASAKYPRPSGIGPFRLLSERPHGARHTRLVEQPHVVKVIVSLLFRLHSVAHFCYSLSSIPLFGRRAGGDARSVVADRVHPGLVYQTVEGGPVSGGNRSRGG